MGNKFKIATKISKIFILISKAPGALIRENTVLLLYAKYLRDTYVFTFLMAEFPPLFLRKEDEWKSI